uniref:Uncharacterized protein n=1 Tax=Anguilla anguilla TaxID=7936 RepID=A0A0E9T7U2_ANGAN
MGQLFPNLGSRPVLK